MKRFLFLLLCSAVTVFAQVSSVQVDPTGRVIGPSVINYITGTSTLQVDGVPVGPGGGGAVSITATAPIVVTPSPLIGVGVISIASGAFEVPLTFSQSLTRATNTVTLSGDSATPGNSQYYGTNSGGTKGWFALPAGGGVTSVFTRTGAVVAASGDYAAFYQPLDTDLTTWAGITPATGVGTWLATPSSANLRGALTDENGTGAALFSGATTPDFTTGITIGGAAASRKMLVGDGTKFAASTETWAVPGASTNNVLKSDGTNWTATQLGFSNLSGNWTLAQGPSTTASALLGRGSASAGIPQEITLGTNLSMSGTTLNAAAGGGGGDVTGPASSSDNQLPVFSGTKVLKNATATGMLTLSAGIASTLSPSAITFPRINADNSVSALDAATFRTAIGAGTGSGDVTGPASSTNLQLPVFSGTSGKTLIASTGTGLVTMSTGVVSVTPDNHTNWDTAFSNNLKWDGTTASITQTQAANTVFGNATASTAVPTFSSSPRFTAIGNLTTNGFVKTGGGVGTLSVDTSTYLTGNQSISLTGDVTGSGTTAITTVLANIPDLAPAVGSVLFTNIAAPASPAATKDKLWFDTTDQRMHDKNSAGTIGTTAVAKASTGSQWLNSMSTAGVFTSTQPAFTDISGSVAAGQLPNPSASTLGGVRSYAAVANQWINAISTSGIPSSTQPAFTDISGTATNAQLPTTISSKTFDDTNTYTAKDGSFTLENTTTTTKKAIFGLSNITAGQTRTINVPDANSTTIQSDTGASNNFLTAVSAQGVISKARPTISNLTDLSAVSKLVGSGTASAALSEITLGSGLSMSGTTLNASGVVGGAPIVYLQTTDTDPTGTISTTGVMAGLAGSLTPVGTGKVFVTVTGYMGNSGNDNGAAATLAYGTGTAPANGAALTGTTVGATTSRFGTGWTLNMRTPFSVSGVISGLTPGTPIWIDLQQAAVTGGTASLTNVTIAAFELPSGTVSDTAFGAGWDAVTDTAPSKNAVYDWATKFAGGTTSQVLQKNSNTDYDIGWTTAAGGGNVSNSGTPTANQLPIWTSATAIKGVTGLTGGTTGDVLKKNSATDYDWTWGAGGGGGIGGSTGATDNAILRADGTGGATLQTSGVTINDSSQIVFPNNSIILGASNFFEVYANGTHFDFAVAASVGAFLSSGEIYGWSNSATDPTGTTDTALARNAAGIVEVNNGTAGTYRDLKADELNAVTGFQVNGAAPSNYELTGNGTDFVGKASDIPNGSSAQQTGFASNTYLAGSVITLTAGDFKVGSTYRCMFDMAKTTAGSAAPVITIYVGTNGSTADTAAQTITFAAATGVADTGMFEVWVNFRAVGASATISSVGRCIHNLAATGLTSTGASGSGTVSNSTSSTFNSTAATKIGIAFNGGASYVGTNNIVQAYYSNP